MAARLAWSNTAPLGWPLVPLVHTTATTSSSCSAGRRRGPPAAATSARSLRSTTLHPSGGGDGNRAGSSQMSNRGATRLNMLATSPGPSLVLIPELIAPRRMAAW